MTSELHLADTNRFKIRPATKGDLQTLTDDIWFNSFGLSSFWAYLFPDSTICRRQYLDRMWAIGLENPTDRTFVAVDTQEHDRFAGFSRWQIPQADSNRGRQCRFWPDIPGGLFDMELIEAFFGGVEVNRKEVMGERSHWCASQLKWGTDQADEDSLETYLDGSTAGQPYYEKRHGFVPVKKMPIPDREPRGALSMPR
ncbi:unnamed protein product [Zymoseptoria tritici ST99CH_1A5]|uniref:N-acetyltransferase domain-containing protein n=1 Tax=Zymoseptoria tritici ST99CH_1A5 TaxID=1276529 RepID=A0A1Y6L8P9_ZYMTR|nr:unnamed protein product [Zymoseptoria tritici ST99CH_1A5]